MEHLLQEIRSCTICKEHIPGGPRPILAASASSKIAIIGQAPGSVVHRTGIPWDDKSGERLRAWLGVDKATFYDENTFALIPMGFCYPGKGKSGDLPPRPECAPKWHGSVLEKILNLKLTVLIGTYAQNYYLGTHAESTLTETVQNFEAYLPEYFVLPHPSPRNNIWMAKHPWFEKEVLPALRKFVDTTLERE